MKTQGDPKIRILGYGAEIDFTDGQPEMDETVENEMMIRLFTRRGWVGNMYAREEKNLIGSDFEELHDKPITSTLITDIRDAAFKALSPMLDAGTLADLDVYASNPDGRNIYTIIASLDSKGVERNFKISRTAGRWIAQRIEADAKVAK